MSGSSSRYCSTLFSNRPVTGQATVTTATNNCAARACWWGLSPLGISVTAAAPCSFYTLVWNLRKATFGPSLSQLPVLNKPCKHLGLHEDAEETADAFGRHGLPEGLSLEDPLPALFFSDEEGVMSHGLQKEADEGLRHQAVQGVILYRHKGDVQFTFRIKCNNDSG